MIAILAIDPSLASTGVARWALGHRLHLSTVHSAPHVGAEYPAWSFPARTHRIVAEVMDLVVPDVTVAVIEDMIKPSEEQMRGTSTLDLARLRGDLESALYRARVPFTRIHPSTVKSYAVKGGATKQEMVRAARDYLGSEYPVRTSDEADAWWLCAMALHRYVGAVVPVTKERSRSIAAVRSWAAVPAGWGR